MMIDTALCFMTLSHRICIAFKSFQNALTYTVSGKTYQQAQADLHTYTPLLLTLFAKCKVFLPSTWLLTLGSWTNGSSITWELLRNADSQPCPRPPYQNLHLNKTTSWFACPPSFGKHWSSRTSSRFLPLYSPLLLPHVFPTSCKRHSCNPGSKWEWETHLILCICTDFIWQAPTPAQ